MNINLRRVCNYFYPNCVKRGDACYHFTTLTVTHYEKSTRIDPHFKKMYLTGKIKERQRIYSHTKFCSIPPIGSICPLQSTDTLASGKYTWLLMFQPLTLSPSIF
uniref:Uncharacterized protein n=1 Tax=Cacopsylla melanoneura TaxID=428564 RepID=A0A8D8LEL9_9HEMI